MRYNGNNLKEVLDEHAKWLNGQGGSLADFSNAFVAEESFVGTALCQADFTGANIENCNFDKALLNEALFAFANLEHVTFTSAEMMYANFYRTTMNDCGFDNVRAWYCDFTQALMENCDLENGSFENSTFVNADFQFSYLINASFKGASIYGANIPESCGDEFEDAHCPLACPDVGAFDAWKKCTVVGWNADNCIVKLRIPSTAKRSSATGSKCRASKAVVVAIESLDGTMKIIAPSDEVYARSWYNRSFVYKVGDTVEVNNFDENRFHECAPGIHFFVSRQAAVEY